MVTLELARYRRIVVLTGAGVSVASGVRPYRGPTGLWTERPELEANVDIAQIGDDLDAVWRVFGRMRAEVLAAAPNPAHLALAALERDPDREVTVLTQNVDGLHARAGSQAVVEVHGNLLTTRCSRPACALEPFEDPRPLVEAPSCPLCRAPLRPDVVLFGEAIPAPALRAARHALDRCDLFLAVGTSGTVSPASNFVRAAEYAGAWTVYLNLEPLDPPNPMFKEQLLGRAEQLLPGLLGG